MYARVAKAFARQNSAQQPWRTGSKHTWISSAGSQAFAVLLRQNFRWMPMSEIHTNSSMACGSRFLVGPGDRIVLRESMSRRERKMQFCLTDKSRCFRRQPNSIKVFFFLKSNFELHVHLTSDTSVTKDCQGCFVFMPQNYQTFRYDHLLCPYLLIPTSVLFVFSPSGFFLCIFLQAGRKRDQQAVKICLKQQIDRSRSSAEVYDLAYSRDIEVIKSIQDSLISVFNKVEAGRGRVGGGKQNGGTGVGGGGGGRGYL